MRHTFKTIAFLTAVLGLCLAAGPAAAQTTGITVTYDGTNSAMLRTVPDEYGLVSDLANALFPGEDDAPATGGNRVTVNYTNPDAADPHYVFGGLSNSGGNVANNTVEIINNLETSEVYGGYVYVKSAGAAIEIMAAHNTVNLYNNVFINDKIYGGYADARNYITDSADADAGAAASGNQITVKDGVVVGGVSYSAYIYGGYAVADAESPVAAATTAHAEDNRIEISGDAVIGDETYSQRYVYGGYAQAISRGVANPAADSTATARANNNALVIGGNAVTAGGYGDGLYAGGYAVAYGDEDLSFAQANNNQVTIHQNARLEGNVYGGIFESRDNRGEAKNNTITIGGTANLSGAVLYGNNNDGNWRNLFEPFGVGLNGAGVSEAPAGLDDVSTAGWRNDNNTLVVNNFSGVNGAAQVGGVYNFANYHFILGANVSETQAALNVIGHTNDPGHTVDIAGATVGVIGFVPGVAATPGAKFMLINAINDDIGDGDFNTIDSASRAFQGFSLAHDLIYYTADFNGGNVLMAEITGTEFNPQTAAWLKGRQAQLAFLNQKNDELSSRVLPWLARLYKTEGQKGFRPFAATFGGQSKYTTGSSFDVEGVGVVAGLAYTVNSGFTLGAFFEGGWGNYSSRNSFSNLPGVKGHGDTEYYGGGVMARYQTLRGLYGQGSFSLGRADTDFSSRYFTDSAGNHAKYDSRSTYYSAHAGLGYLLNLKGAATADLYARYLWTRQTADSLKVGGDPLRFKAMDSHRLQLGGRLDVNLNAYVTPYIGAAWDYEFAGKAKGTAYGYALNSAHVKGGTGMGEVGLSFTPGVLSVDASTQGYIGKREGYSVSIKVGLSF